MSDSQSDILGVAEGSREGEPIASILALMGLVGPG